MTKLSDLVVLIEQNQIVDSVASSPASTVVAALALVISALAVAVSVWTLKQQRTHNRLTVRPIPEITVADYEDLLRIKLRNHGSGPLLIKSLTASFQGKSCQSLVDCMPDLGGRHWTNFSGVIDNRALLPGKEIVLLELTRESGEMDFGVPRDLARLALSRTEMLVIYTDVYESKFDPYKKSLSWFGRNLE